MFNESKPTNKISNQKYLEKLIGFFYLLHFFIHNYCTLYYLLPGSIDYELIVLKFLVCYAIAVLHNIEFFCY